MKSTYMDLSRKLNFKQEIPVTLITKSNFYRSMRNLGPHTSSRHFDRRSTFCWRGSRCRRRTDRGRMGIGRCRTKGQHLEKLFSYCKIVRIPHKCLPSPVFPWAGTHSLG